MNPGDNVDLSLKYRPRRIEDIIQPSVQRALSNAVTSGRVLQFYLFSGPRGSGKTSTARWLAMAVSCQSRTDHNPCGACDSCQMALDGAHPDVIELNAAQYTGKDVMEERVLSTIRHPALLGATKTYILDECHKLSEAAQQSLLKCLEEPPSYVLFIFCTTEPRKVLETIVDRSISFQFHQIPETAISDHLATICSSEGIAIEDAARQIIAQESRGSMRRALKILQKMGSTNISRQDAEEIVGRTSSSAAISYMALVVQEKFKDALQFVENLRVQGKEVDGLFRECLQILADVVRAKVDSPGISRRSYSESESKAILKLAELLTGPTIRVLIDVFERAIALSSIPAMPATLVAVAASTDAVSAVSNHKRKGQTTDA